MIAWTASGASTGAIASPPGVSWAWRALAESPLAASSRRMTASETGCDSPPPDEPEPPDAGPTLTTPLESPLFGFAAPATGSMACGCAFDTAELLVGVGCGVGVDCDRCC